MDRVRPLLGVLALSLALPAAQPASGFASATEDRLVEAVNDYRRAHGRAPLRASNALEASAGRAARRILRRDRVRHTRRGRRGFRALGENLAWSPGSRRDARRVVRRWARSRSHRRVMLLRRMDYAGAGREYGRLGDRASTVWVLHVGDR